MRSGELRQRADEVSVDGESPVQPRLAHGHGPGLHVDRSEAVTRSAIERKESRGGHTRDDYPDTDPQFGTINLVTRRSHGEMTVVRGATTRRCPRSSKQILEENV